MSPWTVTSQPDTERVTAITLASLPVSYTPAPDGGQASVAVISGAGDWAVAARHCLDRGNPTVIVTHPGPADVSALDGTDVLIDSLWAANPTVAEASGRFASRAERAELLECRVVSLPGRSLAANLLDVAALVRTLLGPLEAVEVIHAGARGVVAGGRVGDLRVAVTVVRSTGLPPAATVRMLTDDGGVELTVPDPATARPAALTITDPDGLRQLPSIWESGHRATWRRAASGAISADLADFAADQLLLAALDLA